MKLTLLEAAKSLNSELNDPLEIIQPYYIADIEVPTEYFTLSHHCPSKS